MLEAIKDITLALILAGVFYIGGYTLQNRKRQILAMVSDLVQKAEESIRGSGMGAEKKAIVVAQLEAVGIKVNDSLSVAIDNVVKWLNKNSAWYANEARKIEGGAADVDSKEE